MLDIALVLEFHPAINTFSGKLTVSEARENRQYWRIFPRREDQIPLIFERERICSIFSLKNDSETRLKDLRSLVFSSIFIPFRIYNSYVMRSSSLRIYFSRGKLPKLLLTFNAECHVKNMSLEN